MTKRATVTIDGDMIEALGARRRGGAGRTFLLLLVGGGAYLALRAPERRTRLQTKLRTYSDAARDGTLKDVAQQDLATVRSTVEDLRQKATKAVGVAQKGKEVAQVAKGGVEPLTKLAHDAQVILSSDDPQQVGQAVQDAKAQLGSLTATGREVTQVLEDDSGGEGSTTMPGGPKPV